MTSSPSRHLADALLVGDPTAAADQQSQPGIDLGGPGAGQQDLVESPFHVDRDQAALVDDGHHGNRGPGGAQQAAQATRGGQLGAGVDDRDICGVRLPEQGGTLRSVPSVRCAPTATEGQHGVRVRVNGEK